MIPKLHNLHTYNGLQFGTGTVPLCDNPSEDKSVPFRLIQANINQCALLIFIAL